MQVSRGMPILIDGRKVAAYSEEHRHECEARAIAALPFSQRRAWLETIALKRGEDAAHRLRQTIASIWAAAPKSACAHLWKVTHSGVTYHDCICHHCGETKRETWD